MGGIIRRGLEALGDFGGRQLVCLDMFGYVWMLNKKIEGHTKGKK